MKAPNPPANRFDSSGLFDATRRAFASAALVRGPRSLARRTLAACLLAGLLFGQASAAGVGASARPRTSKAAARKPHATKKAADAAAKDGAAAAKGDEAAAKPTPSSVPASITIEEPDVTAYPSDGGLKKYAIVIKRKEGEFFGTDPGLVSLSLTPAGAADITVRRVTPTRIEADFWAPDNFKVKDVGVSVYDSNNRQLVVASSDVTPNADSAEETEASMVKTSATRGAASKPPAPTAEARKDEQPVIDSTTVIFLQRAYGIGRLKIEGKNFGSYDAPPMTAENYLLCFEPLARQALVNALAEGGHPEPKAQQALEDQRCTNLGTSLADWSDWRKKIEKLVKVALVPRNTDLRIEQTKVLYIDDNLIDIYFEFNRYYHNSEPLRLASATVTVQKPDGQQKPAPKQPPAGGKTQTASAHPADGVSIINASVKPGAAGDDVLPAAQPTPSLKTFIASREVGTKQDENLEYRYTVLDHISAGTLFGKGVAENFYVIQLSVTNKGDKKVAVPLASIQAEVEWAYGPDDQSGQAAGAKKSRGEKAADAAAMQRAEQKVVAGNLLAKSDLAGLSAGQLRALCNTVYARHGRAFQLPELQEYFARRAWYQPRADYSEKMLTANDRANADLINTAELGAKKFTAPAIADTTVTNAGGTVKDGGQKGEGEIVSTASDLNEYYEEGPATLAPLPLPAVTAFFDGDQKTNGTKAKLFNAFDGAAIFGTSLIPFLGQGFQKAEGAFTGGFVPGLRRGLGDLSGQQLQNLAALSWQNIEVVAAGGGSVEKFVFIQRRDQLFSPGFGEQLKKTIKNIEGMEVVGFEVKEGEVKSAKPADSQ